MRVRKTVKTTNMLEVLDCHTAQTNIKNRKRKPKINITPEDVAKNNERKAEDELRRLIDNNFYIDDYYLTLTYKNEPSWEEAKKDITRFINRLKYRCKKIGKELKYIYICEGRKRLHFHIILNRAIEITTKLIKELWPHGSHKNELYQGEAEDAKRVASYFVKEKKAAFYKDEISPFKRRWTSSKNLKKPIVKVEKVKASEWREWIPERKGYYLDTDSVVEGINVAGYPYRFYRLIRIKEIEEVYKKRRRTNEFSTNFREPSTGPRSEIYKNRETSSDIYNRSKL